MKIVIPGGSGQVGAILASSFHAAGDEVVVVSRAARAARAQPWRSVEWDAATRGRWADEIDGADVVINLAGRSVNCRYGRENRRQILESRVVTTRLVGEAIKEAKRPPAVWLQASTATIYAHRFDAANDEASGVIGGDEPGAPDTWRFSIDVAKSWERECDAIVTPRTRKIKMRSAMTMSPDRGGIFDTLLGLVRRGLGGTCGDGRQFVSWIHEFDFVRAVRWIIEDDAIEGAINLASPGALPNREFMRALREAWGISVGLPASRWMLEVGAFLMGTESELVLKSRRVAPGLLLARGFEFEFVAWREAAEELCDRWKIGRRGKQV